MTILASFSLPGIVAQHLHKNYDLAPGFAYNIAQIVTPCSMQILSTPLHLFGLDLYNREDISNKDRIQFIQKEYFKTTLARMARIFPAYGIGGVINKNIRVVSHDRLLYYYG